MNWILVLIITSMIAGPSDTRIELQSVPGFKSLQACHIAGKKLAKKYAFESGDGIFSSGSLLYRSAQPICTPDKVTP
jgi:hypothetical protein